MLLEKRTKTRERKEKKMNWSKSIKYILITLISIGFCVSVLWASTQVGSGDSLEGWIGNTVNVLTKNQVNNHYRVKLISIIKGDPSGVIVEGRGAKTFIYSGNIISITLYK